jgi:hypothetical protein
MTVQIAILKSGENIISDIKEGHDGENVVTYIFNNPYGIVINGTYKVLDDENATDKTSISLYSWPQLSKDRTILIPVNWVVTMVNPHDQVKEMYETEVLNGEKE